MIKLGIVSGQANAIADIIKYLIPAQYESFKERYCKECKCHRMSSYSFEIVSYDGENLSFIQNWN